MAYVDDRDLAVELLNSMKKFFKFRELEELLDLPTPTIWRYIHGEIRPSYDRARQLIQRLLSNETLIKLANQLVKRSDNNLVNVYLVAYNVDILNIASIDAYVWSRAIQPNTVLTIEADGIPLATLIAKRLSAKLVVAKRRKEIGFKRFIETTFITHDPPEVVTLYVPEEMLSNSDRVLIVDDLVKSGRTTRALAEIVKRVNAKIVGFYALMSIGTKWKQIIEDIVGRNYRILINIPS